MIPFNKPHTVGNEFDYISDAIDNGKLSGNGKYTKLCQDFFESKYGFKKTFLTTSCTDALEMCAILLNIKPGDEVIVPSFTFVSTALAFIKHGAKIIFADSIASSDFRTLNFSTVSLTLFFLRIPAVSIKTKFFPFLVPYVIHMDCTL